MYSPKLPTFALVLIGLLLFAGSVYAEGSRDLTPDNTGAANGVNQFVGYLQQNDGANSGEFMNPGAPDFEKLYIRMRPGETLYYGIRRNAGGGNNQDVIINIRRNDGTLLQTTTLN